MTRHRGFEPLNAFRQTIALGVLGETDDQGADAGLLADKLSPVQLEKLSNYYQCLSLIGQIVVSAGIFGATVYDDGTRRSEVLLLTDQFTLWTNTVLGVNALAQLIALGVGATQHTFFKHCYNLSTQMQLNLLPGTVLLGGMMLLSKHIFDLHPKGKATDWLTLVQHVPSVFVGPLMARVNGQRSSAVFIENGLSFTLMRFAFSVMYVLRNTVGNLTGYMGFTARDDEGNVKASQVAFLSVTLAIFVTFAQVGLYSLWYGLGKVADCIPGCQPKEDALAGSATAGVGQNRAGFYGATNIGSSFEGAIEAGSELKVVQMGDQRLESIR